MEDKLEDNSIVIRKISSIKDVQKLKSVLEKCIRFKMLRKDKSASLNLAINSRIEQVIPILLNKNADIEVKKEEGKVPLLAKAKNGIQSLIKLFLLTNTNVNYITEERLTPLYVGLKHNRIDVIKQILENNVDINARSAVRCNFLHDTVDNELISLLDLLLHHGFDEDYDDNWERDYNFNNSKSPFNRFTPLHLAIKNNNFSTDKMLSIICLLIEDGVDIELKDKFGRTPLYLAIELKKLDVAKFLIITGANVNCVTTNYSRPIFAALVNADLDSLYYLLSRGAKVNVKNYQDESPLHVAIRVIDNDKVRYSVVQLLLANRVKINDRDSEKSTALHLALEKEDFSLFYLLISRGSFIHLKNSYGFSPLYVAVARSLLEEAKILLKLGANVNDFDNHKITILAEAVEQGDEDIIQLLLRHNANVKDKNSVLVAADNGNVSVMNILVDRGADINIVDKVGLSVLVHAILFKQDAMVQYLLENGADINYENKNFMPLTYSFLLYNFNAHIIHNPSEKESYKLTMHLMLKYIALRWALNSYIHEANLRLIDSRDVIKRKFEDYCDELTSMKKTKVSADAAVTYFDLLVKRHNALVQCFRCVKVRDELSASDYGAFFIEYAHQLKKNCNKGLNRWSLITRFERALNDILKSVLPCNVTYKICEYFSDDDIKTYFREQR